MISQFKAIAPKLTLRNKILLLMAALTVVPIVTTLIIVNVLTKREIHKTLERDLKKTQQLLENYQSIQSKEITAQNRLISEIPFFKAVVATKDKTTIQEFIRNTRDRLGSSLLLITDQLGNVLASTDELLLNKNIANESAIKGAMQEGEKKGFLITQNAIYQVTTSTIRLGDTNLGTISIGISIDNKLAEEIKKITDSEISFIGDGRLIVSTWKNNQTELLNRWLKTPQDYSIKSFDLDMGVGRYVSVLVPVAAEGDIRVAYLIQRSRDDVTRFLDTIINSVFIVGFLILIGTFWISFMAAKQISDPISVIVQNSREMADGNLSISVSVKHRDEIGNLADAFNEMAKRLRGLISHVRENIIAVNEVSQKLHQISSSVSVEIQKQKMAVEETASSIMQTGAAIQEMDKNVELLSSSARDTSSSILEMDSSIEEIVANMDTLSSSIDFTAVSITELVASIKEIANALEGLHGITEETASSLHELNVSVQEVERNAQKSCTLSEKTNQDAGMGMQSVNETINAMREIKTIFIKLQENISHLAERSESIDKIVNVISQITEQINLLSLNAAIIAAQAGEHGRGFAVVAAEIKNLAENTASSTHEIAALIGNVKDEISNSVDAMKYGAEKVQRGVTLSEGAGNILKVIIDSSKASTGMVNEIVKATKEQAISVQMVDSSMLKIEEMVKQINYAIQEQKKASDGIEKAVEDMRLLGQKVKNSTTEQSKGSKLITDAAEQIMAMINHILQAIHEQSNASKQINHALDTFKDATNTSAQRSSEMNNVVAVLSERSQQLEHEISRFKII